MRKNILATLLLSVSSLLAATENTDFAKDLRRMPGEVMTELHAPNLLKNSDFAEGLKYWTIVNSEKNGTTASVCKPDDKNALEIKGDAGYTIAVSDPIDVTPGKKYLLTGVYQSANARFGAFSEFGMISASDIKKVLNILNEPQYYSVFMNRETYNRRPLEWQRRSIIFTPKPGQDKVRIIISQYGTPARVLYGRLYFGEETPDSRKTDHKKYYIDNKDPKLAENEVNAILTKRQDSTAEIKNADYPRIFVDGKATPSLIYFGDAFEAPRSKMQDFQKAGISLQILSLHSKLKIWKVNNSYDFKKMDDHLLDAISRNPEGHFIIRMDVTPYEEWKKEFPEHTARTLSGKDAIGRAGNHAPPCYWSELYREQVCKFLEESVKHMRQQLYFKSVVGFFITGNEDGQFYYQAVDKTLQDGTSKGGIELFRKWIRKQYKTEDNLKKAWNKTDISFEALTPPVKNERYNGCFFNPATNQAEIDFTRFLNEEMGEFANEMCSTVKKEAGKKVISVMWWGRGASLMVYPHFAQTEKILPSGALDLMGAQPGYAGERENGCSSFVSWITDSKRIHGKIPMLEADYRTWKSPYKTLQQDNNTVRYWNLYDLKGALLREYGKMMAVGGGLWFYDMSAGWFQDPEIMQVVSEMKKSADMLTEKTGVFSKADIVLVSDEQNYYYTTEQLNVWNGPNFNTVRINQRAWLRSGLKFDSYYLNDLINKNMTDYKVYVFMNVFHVSPETMNFIETKLKKENKVIVWLYAPGYLTDGGINQENMQNLTGIKINCADNASKKASFVSDDKNILLKDLSNQPVGIGNDMPGERFISTDNNTAVLAKYRDGKNAAVMKKFPQWTSIFIGVPAGLSPQLLQNIATYANVHVYNNIGDLFVYHRDDLICLHGIEGNENDIKLPFDAEVKDLFSGEILLAGGKGLKVKLQPGETRLLLINKK